MACHEQMICGYNDSYRPNVQRRIYVATSAGLQTMALIVEKQSISLFEIEL